MIKNQSLTRTDIQSITGAVANDYEGQRNIIPAWKRGMSNKTSQYSEGSDDLIGFPHGYGVHGDLIIHASWAAGLGVVKVNNDGSFTRVYSNTDPSGAYGDANNQSIVLHKPSKKFVIMSYDNNGYSIWNYAPCFSGNAPTLVESGGTFMSAGGSAVADVGSSYYSGLSIAGDWVYGVDESATHYKAILRRDITDDSVEKIDFTTSQRSGSATIDRNGYRGTLFYDEVNDRMFYCTYYNANMTVIYDASTSSPSVVWVDLADAGLGNDAYEQGLFIPDPVNAPNVLIVGCNSRHAKIDMSRCLTGTQAPVVTSQYYTEDGANGQRYGNYFRAGGQVQSITNEHSIRNPGFSNFCPTTSDRGRNMLDGWIDQDNDKIVGVYRHDSTTEDTTTGGRGRSYRSDYGTPIFRMQSADGTFWWIKLGYGYDGHTYVSWSNDIGNGLIGNWEIIYGAFTLDNSANVDFVHLEKTGHYTPGGCSLSYYVSNNNGSTWETYSATGSSYHTFTSSGTQLRIKYTAVGQSDKAPYKLAPTFDYISYGSLYESVKDATVPYKVSRKKIRGKK